MDTYLLLWNPSKWEWEELPDISIQTQSGQVIKGQWSCGNRKQMEVGSKIFLMQVGRGVRGIMGEGETTSVPFRARGWKKKGRGKGSRKLYVKCKWNCLLNPETDEILTLKELHKGQLRSFDWTPAGGGILVPPKIASALCQSWNVRKSIPRINGFEPNQEATGWEGGRKKAIFYHICREQKLRGAKIKAALKENNGRLKCEVRYCGFDFVDVYGRLGYAFAHVHHLKPLRDRTAPSKTRLSDLAIVCPNCHSMIHKGGKCRDIKRLIPEK